MATIKHKRGTSKPSTSNVAVGELAINTTDGSLYTQNDSSKVIQISPDVINVKNYGATGDGSTDDTAEIQAALNAGVVGGKLVVFPAGVYVVTDELDVAIDADLEQVHIEAQGNAIIKFVPTSNKNLLHITLSNSQNHYLEGDGAPRISIKGLKFAYAATTNSWGNAILINGCNVAGRHTGMSYIENCQFMPWSDATKFFSIGLQVVDFHEITISNCSFFADQASPKVNTGIYFTGTSTGQSCHYYIDNCTFLYGNCGIRSTTYIEGFYINNCSFVASTNGIFCDADSAGASHTEPGLQVTSSHFNMGDSGNANWCVEGQGLTDVLISNCLLYNGYNNPQNSDGVITRGCIKLDKATGSSILGNVFKRVGGNTLSSFANAHYNVGIYILDAYGYKTISIQNNVFEDFNSAKRAVWLGADSEEVIVLNNVYANGGGDVVDEGTNNVVKSLRFGDSATTLDNSILLGAGNDLTLYHDGTNSIIKNNTNDLFIQNASGNANQVFIRGLENENSITANANGSVQLYYDNAEKLATTSTGVTVTGLRLGDSTTGSDETIFLGADQDLRLYHDGSNGVIQNDTGHLYIQNDSSSTSDIYIKAKAGEHSIVCKPAAGVEFYCGNVKQFETQADGVLFPDGKAAKFGAGADLKIWHDGSHSNMRTTEGALYFQAPAGTWTYRATSTGGHGIAHFNSDVGSTGALRAYITADGDYVDVSDYRLKQDFVSITNGIDLVKQLKPTTFKWKNDTSSEKVYGFIAHEVQEVLPEIVTGEKDGEENQFLCKADFIPVLTAALKEAIAKIEVLETEVATLKG